MNRRGMALVATLWLVVALAGVTALGLSTAQHGIWTGRNRIWQIRTGWAREACWSIVRGRYAAQPAGGVDAPPPEPAGLPRTDLGQGLWCEAVWEHPDRQLNLNTITAPIFFALLRDPDRVAAVLDWRDPDTLPRAGGAERQWYVERGLKAPRDGPFAAVEELRFVRGLDRALVASLDTILTVRGNGTLDLNSAPLATLRVLPGLGDEALAAIAQQRRLSRRVSGWGDLIPSLSPPAAAALAAEGGALLRLVAFETRERWIILRAGITGTPFSSESRLTLVPGAGRLSVVQVEAP